jgi:hypothetical protein
MGRDGVEREGVCTSSKTSRLLTWHSSEWWPIAIASCDAAAAMYLCRSGVTTVPLAGGGVRACAHCTRAVWRQEDRHGSHTESTAQRAAHACVAV